MCVQRDTTIHTACGRCNKQIFGSAATANENEEKPSVTFAFCQRCRRFALCSIWFVVLIPLAKTSELNSPQPSPRKRAGLRLRNMWTWWASLVLS
jgi:hypothetical protein